MKKLFLLAAFAVMGLTTVHAQDVLDVTGQGKWLVEVNTGFGEASKANTGLSFNSTDGATTYSIGGEAGYFVINDLALKVGLGYAGSDIDGFDTDSTFRWKVGGKYYIAKKFPVAVDVNGSSTGEFSPMWVGVQGGYAWFVANNISIEPGVRYGYGLNEEAGDGDANLLGVNVGFNVFF